MEKKEMKSVKKKYMKPSIKVAEWDFNEAVCTDGIITLSICNVHSEKGSVEVQMNNFGGDLTWHDTPTSAQQSRRGF